MVGFWDNPEATAQRMTQDQFVLTGDIGKLDQNGYLYVLDRKDDMIISGGYNIWPAELENVIQGHHAVIEVAVVSVPHVRWGESSMALCVIEAGAEVSEQEIIELCAAPLGFYNKPSAVQFRIPRTEERRGGK